MRTGMPWTPTASRRDGGRGARGVPGGSGAPRLCLRAYENRNERGDESDFAPTGDAGRDRMRVRLREEARAPFRAARLFVYPWAFIGGWVGGLVQVARGDEWQSVAVDFGLSAAVGVAWFLDRRRDQRELARGEAAAAVASLCVAVPVSAKGTYRKAGLGTGTSSSSSSPGKGEGEVVRLGQLRGRVRVVVVCGSAGVLTEALSAVDEATQRRLVAAGVAVVLCCTDGSDPVAVLEAAGCGDPLYDESAPPWVCAASNKGESWAGWLRSEEAARQAAEGGVYVIVRADGRVGARGLGSPPWKRLVAECERMPTVPGLGSLGKLGAAGGEGGVSGV